MHNNNYKISYQNKSKKKRGGEYADFRFGGVKIIMSLADASSFVLI